MYVIELIKQKYNNLSRVAKASLWFIICGFMQRGISVITTPIFTRLLATSEYGSYSVFNSWLEIITIFATLKLGHGVYMQGLVKYSEDQDKLSSSLLGLATAWWSAFLGIYLLAHDFWNRVFGLSTYMMLCMFVMMIATVGFNFWSARQRNGFKYVRLVQLTILISLLKPATGILAVLCTEHFKVEARITALAAVELIAYAFLYIGIMAKGKRFYHKDYWKYALAFNIPLIPHFLSQVILNHSDRIMIQKLVGNSEAGIYSLAYSIAVILTMLNTSIQNAMRPWVFQKLKAKRQNEIQPVVIRAIIIVAMCNLALITFAPEVIAIFAPASYTGANNLIAPLTMSVYFMFMYNLFVDVEMYFEKTKSIMVIAIICALVNIISNYFFIGMFGYAAAAYTTIASYILMAGLHYISMKLILKKQKEKIKVYDAKIMLFMSVVFIIMGTILGQLASYLIIRLIVVGVGIVITYIKREKLSDIFRIIKSRS